MRAVTVPEFGGPEVLEVRELPTPPPGPGEIRIRVAAATVNPADTLLRAGVLPLPLDEVPRPYIPGLELAGRVDAVGPDTGPGAPRPGDAVLAVTTPVRVGGGGQAELTCVPVEWTAPVPEGLTPVEAATIPMNGLTAWRALQVLDLRPGDTVAVTGAVGAVGGYVLTLASQVGLRVIADAAEADGDAVRALGATEIVPRGPGVAAAIREAVPAGVDGLIDASVQGPAVVLAAIRAGGRYASVRSGGEPHTERGITLHPVRVTELMGDRALLAEVARRLAGGPVRPRVAHAYAPEQVAEAHRALEAGGLRGRLVLGFDPV